MGNKDINLCIVWFRLIQIHTMYFPRSELSTESKFLISFVDTIFDGKVPDFMIILKALQYTKASNLRALLGNLLLKKSDKAELPEKTFAIIVDIVKATLREANNSKDYGSAKTFIDLCSIFYLVNDSGIAVFMLESIIGHEIWQNSLFWIDLFTGLLSDVNLKSDNKEAILLGMTAILYKKMINVQTREDVRYKFVGYVNSTYEISLTIKGIQQHKAVGYSVVEEIKKNKEKKIEKEGEFNKTNDKMIGESMLINEEGDNLLFMKADLHIQTLSGERNIWKLSGIACEGHKESARGVLFLTNYRLSFVPIQLHLRDDNFLQDLFTIPLGCISQCGFTSNAKVDTTFDFVINTKDFRSLYFTPSELDRKKNAVEPFMRLLYNYSFPNYNEVKKGNTFAFMHKDPTAEVNDFTEINIKDDYRRQGVFYNPKWRLSLANFDFSYCSSYPDILVVPSDISDAELMKVKDFRSRGRLPALTWTHPSNSTVLLRCSQPESGITGRRCVEDEKLFNVTEVKYIFDARPKINAVANSVKGKGFENMQNYDKNCALIFLDIENIHEIRKSLQKVMEITLNYEDYSSIYDEITPTLWFKHIQLIIVGAQRIAYAMQIEKTSSVIHCSDGWDRTAQLSALAQLLLDPFYRTIKGFCYLIEKDWIAFGHMFAHRVGHGSSHHDDGERSPIFLQFLDCVFQIYNRAVCDFEFNEYFLSFIMEECYACRFGTFLYNSESERRNAKSEFETCSLWAYILNNSEKFTSDVYRANPQVIMLDYQFTNRNMRLWPYLYRWNRKLRENADIEYSFLINLKGQISEYKALHFATEVRVASATRESRKSMDALKTLQRKYTAEVIDVLEDKYITEESEEENDEKVSKTSVSSLPPPPPIFAPKPNKKK